MALWRKSFNNLGGTDYTPDARVAESQAQQQISNANNASLRAHELQKQQLQQQQAAAGWQNKRAADAQLLEQMRAQFMYGEDAQGLRQQQAQLPWAQLGEQGRQFDSRQGLAEDKFGFQQEQFDYGKSMSASPEEAAAQRRIQSLLDQDKAKRSGVLNSDEALRSMIESITAQQQGNVVRNDPNFLRQQQGEQLRSAKNRNELGAMDLSDRLVYGDAKLQNDQDMSEVRLQQALQKLGLDSSYGRLERELDIQGKATQNNYNELRLQNEPGRIEGDRRSSAELSQTRALGNTLKAAQIQEKGDERAYAMQQIQSAEEAQAAKLVQEDPGVAQVLSGEVSVKDLPAAIEQIMLKTPVSQRSRVASIIRRSEGAILDAGENELSPVGSGFGQYFAIGSADTALKSQRADARTKAKHALEKALLKFER